MKDEDWVLLRDARVKHLEKECEDLRKQIGMVARYSATSRKPPKWMSTVGKGKTKALLVGQLSDTHFCEVVEPREMNFLNAYDEDIAEQRLKRWAAKVCEFSKREHFEWMGFLGLLSGDIFSGNIHAELARTNSSHMPEAIVKWVPLVAAAIGQVVDACGRAYFDCVVGNHGRLTAKPEFKGRARNNFDWAFYKLVASHFKNDDRVEFHISDAPYSFAPLPDGRFVCHSHGDEEQGGNSATGGVMYALGRIRTTGIKMGALHEKKVAYATCGHWHSTFLAQQAGIVCNGSMKGYDEYAHGKHLTPEQAAQNLWVEVPGKGTVLSASLYLQDRQKEGW